MQWRRAFAAAALGAAACGGPSDRTAERRGSPDTAAAPSRPSGPALSAPPADSSVPTAAGTRPRPCGGFCVNVIVQAGALPVAAELVTVERELRALAGRLIRPLGERVVAGSVEVSPAVRAFRVSVPDSAAATAVVQALRARPEVDAAELDECSVRVGGS